MTGGAPDGCVQCGADTPLPFLCRQHWHELGTRGQQAFYHAAQTNRHVEKVLSYALARERGDARLAEDKGPLGYRTGPIHSGFGSGYRQPSSSASRVGNPHEGR